MWSPPDHNVIAPLQVKCDHPFRYQICNPGQSAEKCRISSHDFQEWWLFSAHATFEMMGSEFQRPKVHRRWIRYEEAPLKDSNGVCDLRLRFTSRARSGRKPQYRAELADREFLPNKIALDQVPRRFLVRFPSFLTHTNPILLVKLVLSAISQRAAKHAIIPHYFKSSSVHE